MNDTFVNAPKKKINKMLFERIVWFISLRYLMSSKRSKLPSMVTFLSFFSVAISISIMIVVTSIFNGFETMLTEKVLGFNSHIGVYAKEKEFPVNNNIVKLSKEIDGVKIAYMNIESQGMIVNKDKGFSFGVLVNGIPKEAFLEKSKSFDSMHGCKPDDFQKKEDQIVLSSALASRIGAILGSKVSLMIPREKETVFGVIPKTKTYNVSCIVSMGMYQYDEIYSFLPINEAEKFLKDTFFTRNIGLILDNPFQVQSVAIDLGYKMKGLSDWNPYNKYLISDWKSENQSLIEALNVEGSVMKMVISLFICMAMFAVFSNIFLMIKEKRKSIAIFMSMGLTKMQIGQIFFLCGTVIGLSGTVIGALLGLLISNNIQTIKQFLEHTFSTLR